uniref:Uncharacterized protein n=1 Tax=Anguilla anguilla TaxID=7936 RepID=A0A0E9RDF2_ANGAN
MHRPSSLFCAGSCNTSRPLGISGNDWVLSELHRTQFCGYQTVGQMKRSFRNLDILLIVPLNFA